MILFYCILFFIIIIILFSFSFLEGRSSFLFWGLRVRFLGSSYILQIRARRDEGGDRYYGRSERRRNLFRMEMTDEGRSRLKRDPEAEKREGRGLV